MNPKRSTEWPYVPGDEVIVTGDTVGWVHRIPAGTKVTIADMGDFGRFINTGQRGYTVVPPAGLMPEYKWRRVGLADLEPAFQPVTEAEIEEVKKLLGVTEPPAQGCPDCGLADDYCGCGLTDVTPPRRAGVIHVTEVEEWGVRWVNVKGRGREVGQIEWLGTKPDGTTGTFTEDEARYIASSGNQEVVKRTVRTTRVTTPWKTVED